MKRSFATSVNPNIIGAFWMIGSVICFLTSIFFVKVSDAHLPLSAVVGMLFFGEPATGRFAVGSLLIIAADFYVVRKKSDM